MVLNIEITHGQHGFFLMVNGKAIKKDINASNGVMATQTPEANNWIATEFASIKALREFWHKYMTLIIHVVK